MKALSELLTGIEPSVTLAVNDKAQALRRAGHDVIALAGGDPDFRTPQHIIDAAVASMDHGATNYPAPTKGIIPALEAIAQKVESDSGVAIDPLKEVIVTPGGKWALNLALGAIVNPGDEVLYFEPVWVSYPPMIRIAGGIPVGVSLSAADNFTITAAAIEAKMTSHTKAIMLTSPCNPTGRVLTSEEAAVICNVAQQHDLYVIYDELYEKLIFDERTHISLVGQPGMRERTLTINGLSKGYAMTGWRLGWLVAPPPIIALASRLNGQTVTCAAHFTMYGAIAALTGPQEPFEEMRQSYQARRDFMTAALNEMPGIECAMIDGAFYLFPRFTHTTRNSVDLAEALIEKAMVVGTPGIAFGQSGEGHLRFSIATAMSDLERAVERIAKIAVEL